jgi:hypothetical protein
MKFSSSFNTIYTILVGAFIAFQGFKWSSSNELGECHNQLEQVIHTHSLLLSSATRNCTIAMELTSKDKPTFTAGKPEAFRIFDDDSIGRQHPGVELVIREGTSYLVGMNCECVC